MRGVLIQRGLLLLAVTSAAISAFAFYGIFDGESGDPRRGLADAIYASLQLFTLSLDRPPTNEGLPVILHITRFVAPMVTAGAVWVAAASFARSWIDRRSARRWSGHDVVCGDTANAQSIAIALARTPSARGFRRGSRHVIYVTDHLSVGAGDGLRAKDVLGIETTPDSPAFADALRNSRSVTVAFDSDADTIRWALAADRQLHDAGGATRLRVKAVVAKAPALRRVIGSGIQFVNLIDRMSHGVVAAEPFRPTPSGKGPAVVVGDGPGATSLARHLGATGSSNLTQPAVILGSAGTLVGVAPNTSVIDTPGDSDPSRIAALIEKMVSEGEIGDPIYIWSGDAGRDLALAFYLSSHSAGRSLVVVSSTLLGDQQRGSLPGNIRIVDSQEALGRGHLLATEPREMLASGLEFERLRHGDGQFKPVEGPNALDILRSSGVESAAVADEILACLSELDLEVSEDDAPVLHLAPSEIRTLARRLAEFGGIEVAHMSDIHPFAVLAARVPRIVDFTSLSLRPVGAAIGRTRIDLDAASTMAVHIGANYQVRSGGPAQLSAAEASDADIDQALDFSVKLAVAGLDLDDQTRGAAVRLPDHVVDLLAEFEHQRWCRNRRERGWRFGEQRDNDRLLHPDMVPWDDLSERSKELDRGPVRDMPSVLATAGLHLTDVLD